MTIKALDVSVAWGGLCIKISCSAAAFVLSTTHLSQPECPKPEEGNLCCLSSLGLKKIKETHNGSSIPVVATREHGLAVFIRRNSHSVLNLSRFLYQKLPSPCCMICCHLLQDLTKPSSQRYEICAWLQRLWKHRIACVNYAHPLLRCTS